jgi:hypothetical protein
MKNGKIRIVGSDAAHRIDVSVFASTPRDLHDGATCTTRRCTSTSLKARLKNSNPTCIYTKQAAKSRHVSYADLPLLVLWRNRQIETNLVLRFKPRNHHINFEPQITKLYLMILIPKSEKSSSTDFEAKLGETITTGFEAKPGETITVVLRPNH